jgi:hypothetical protein
MSYRTVLTHLNIVVLSLFLLIAPLLFPKWSLAGNDPVPEEVPTLEALIESYIIEQGETRLVEDIKAAERESGEIDKAFKAVLGISIRDIKDNGLLGGPKSEMRKLFKSLGLSEN